MTADQELYGRLTSFRLSVSGKRTCWVTLRSSRSYLCFLGLAVGQVSVAIYWKPATC